MMLLITGINALLLSAILNCNNISQHLYFLLYQISAALVSRSNFFQRHYNILATLNFRVAYYYKVNETLQKM